MLNKAIHFTKLSKNDYLSSVGALFSMSADDDAIRNAVGDFGYNADRLNEGRLLYDELSLLENEHSKVANEKTLLVAKKQLMQKEIAKTYMKYIKIARIAFADHPQAGDVLMLEGSRERIFNKWFAQVMLFCNNLLDHTDYLPPMEVYGVKAVHIENLKSSLNTLFDLVTQCNKATATLKQLTLKKQKQTIKVQNWVSDYIKIARIALEEQPQQLIKLGITSRKTAAAGEAKRNNESYNVKKRNAASA